MLPVRWDPCNQPAANPVLPAMHVVTAHRFHLSCMAMAHGKTVAMGNLHHPIQDAVQQLQLLPSAVLMQQLLGQLPVRHPPAVHSLLISSVLLATLTPA